ncbi:hypothetical protein DFH09DRAFT_1428808 [Mycena vulgaris]|nr:hypothetical protein DFH09DRAFT_1428808 [Mycena vulgaris]
MRRACVAALGVGTPVYCGSVAVDTMWAPATVQNAPVSCFPWLSAFFPRSSVRARAPLLLVISPFVRVSALGFVAAVCVRAWGCLGMAASCLSACRQSGGAARRLRPWDGDPMQRWGRGACEVCVVCVCGGLWYGGQSRGTARRGLGAGGGGADVPGARAAHGDADAVGRAGRDAAWGNLRAICGGVSRRADGTADGGGGLTETDGETDEHRAVRRRLRGWITGRWRRDGSWRGARTVVSTATRSSGVGSGNEEDDVLRRFVLGDDAMASAPDDADAQSGRYDGGVFGDGHDTGKTMRARLAARWSLPRADEVLRPALGVAGHDDGAYPHTDDV